MIFRRKTERKLLKQTETAGRSQGFGGMLWSRFKKNRMALWSMRILYVLIFFAVFGPFIANEKPLFCKIEGRNYWPVFTREAPPGNIPWREQSYESVLWGPIPYSDHSTDLKTGNFKGPFDDQNIPSVKFRHWLGTADLGQDVMSGMIGGTRVAMLVGLISMSIAAFFGIFFGALAGYFGDERLKVSRGRLILNLIGLFFGLFYGFSVRIYAYSEGSLGWELAKSLGIVLAILLIFNGLAHIFKKIPFFGKKITIPADLIVMRVIEVMNAMPGLLLLLAAVAIIKEPSIFYVMTIIGLIRWTGIARFMRAELLRVRNLTYIEAARALGFSEFRILFRHAIPNALGPVLITIAFGIASAILIESTLSFLGIGTYEEMTWGKLLALARSRPEAWWLAVFPGFAIFIAVTIFNLIGEGLTEAFDTRNRGEV